MVARVASLFACCALLQLLACAPLYDIDDIACNGHGQCPTGYHCQQDGLEGAPAASGMLGVCVSGDRDGAGQSAIVVSRMTHPVAGEARLFAGALFTELASVDRIEEAVWEDVLGLNLLVEAENDGGVRHRAGDANQYPNLGYDPDGSARGRAQAGGLALHIDSLEGVDLSLQGAFEFLSPNQYPVRVMGCGVGNRARISDSPQVLLPGESWYASPGFSEDSIDPGVTGPSMPVMPEPSATLLVAGELLIPWGGDLQITDLAPDLIADTRDVFLIMGPDLGEFNNPDCPETDCTDGSGDEDGDDRANCDDPDCAGRDGCPPASTEEDLSADIAAYRPEGDGSIWRPWDQLPDAVQNGNQDSLILAWSRTRRVTKYEPNLHVESTVVASTALFAVEGKVLEPAQYAVQVITQSGEPDVLQLELQQHQQHQPSEAWAGGMLYEVAIRDRNEETNQAVVYQFASGGPSQELNLSTSGTIVGQVDLRPLCRGVAMIHVGLAGQLPDVRGNCQEEGCGIGTFDYRRPNPVCDLVVENPPGSRAFVGGSEPFHLSQVACGSFPPFNDDELPAEDPSGKHLYRFQASAGITYTFEVLASQLTGDSNSDTSLVLYRAGMDFSPDGGGGWPQGVDFDAGSDNYCANDPRLVWQCQDSGDYILEVQEFSRERTAYKLVTDIR